MGGSAENITLIPLLREGYEDEDTRSIRSSFEEFDSNRCECFEPDDKEKLLTIIRVVFGNLNTFNQTIRALLVESFQNSIAPRHIGP